MSFVVTCFIDGKKTTEIELPKGKSITLGGGAAADVRLTPYFGMPDVCARIWHDDHCLVENLTRKDSIVQLHGRPLFSVALFEVGDVLQIGVDQFQMTRQDETPVAAEKPQPAAPKSSAEPAVNRMLNSTVLSPVLTRHSPVDPKWNLGTLLEPLFEEQQTILFANFRGAGVDAPDEKITGPDLFRDGPDELREQHSLHAIIGGSPEQRLQIAGQLLGKDAVIVALPQDDAEKCLQQFKIFRGWFARPSALEITLTGGARQLSEKLLSPFRGLLIEPAGSASEWVVYSSGRVTQEQLLLPGYERNVRASPKRKT